MFARSISIRLKPNSVAGFTRLIEDESLPVLRKQKGFQDERTFVLPGGSGSSWNQLVGQQRERGGLRPRCLCRSPQDAWEGNGRHSSGSLL
jgi:hypothetical protein